MNARINRIVLKLTQSPHGDQVAVPSQWQADQGVIAVSKAGPKRDTQEYLQSR